MGADVAGLGRLFGRFVARAPLGSFGAAGLGFMEGGTVEALSVDEVRVPLPPWCRKGLAPLVAVMDEASSLTMALRDSRGRFGVSIVLEGHRVLSSSSSSSREKPTPEVVTATTVVRKLGRTIGFADVEVRCATTARVIARGRHIKFLQVGNPVADNVKFVRSLPFVENLVDAYLASKKTHDVLDVEPFFRDGGDVAIVPELCNPWGSLHGGAACVLAERAANREVPLEDDLVGASSLTATFLTALPSRGGTHSASICATKRPDEPTVVDAVIKSSKAQPAVDVTLRYSKEIVTKLE